MHSSTSNSKFPLEYKLLTATAILLAIMLTIVGIIRPIGKTRGMDPLSQLSQKMRWHEQFDIVFGGDSRTQRGVSPGAIEKELPNKKVANFGFSAACLDPKYLSHLKKLIKKQSKKPTIVLGVTALSLTAYAQKNNAYLEYAKKHRAEHYLNAHFGHILHFFRRYKKDEIKQLLGYARAHDYYEYAKNDGWIQSNRRPHIPRYALKEYEKLLNKHPFVPKLQEDLLVKVHELTKAGVRVFAFRPPTTKEMAELEKKLCAFDKDKFIEEFKSYGGKWIEVDDRNYRSYDGSHIDEKSAVKFSKDLAKALVNHYMTSGN